MSGEFNVPYLFEPCVATGTEAQDSNATTTLYHSKTNSVFNPLSAKENSRAEDDLVLFLSF